MTTVIHPALAPNLFQPEACGLRQCVKGDADPLPEPLGKATHTVLQAQKPLSSGPKRFLVNIFDASKVSKVPVTARSMDTIGKLQKKVQKLRPDLRGCGNLVYNGKPVEPQQTLAELQVKPGATFITYHKCHGG
ncbi:hypothetical protein F2P79_007943 [Pimephales promelas]|nr:hypothetical protein F2P79_007943 [Pimephales promelas]KAG1956063.1 hypothetical protein F2P79_007943 [Pimephales promelas]